MYTSLRPIDNFALKSWFTYLRDLLVQHDFGNLLDESLLGSNQYKVVKSKIVTAYHTKFQSLLSTDVFPKLRTYRLFKSKFEMENYLWLQIPKYRVSLARLRTSSHDLEIERQIHNLQDTGRTPSLLAMYS